MDIKVSSDRLYLREFTENDWRDVHSYASLDEVCKYQEWGPNTEDETKAFIHQAIRDMDKAPRSRFAFAVIHKEEACLIGAVELHERDATSDVAEIGYIINPSYWGKGFATEAAKLVVSWGFIELNFHRVDATCDTRNHASARVLEKIGMVQEGRIREHKKLRDGWRDSFLFSVLDREWEFN